jgi:bacterioferritin-associated ferredoxin
MTPVFIFADHVKKILASGKKEIEIPEGARVSAAAYDIIRDNKIRIIQVAPGKSAVASESRSGKNSPGTEGSKSETSPDDDDAGEISEDVLEDIIDRVIQRFKQAKGLHPTTTAAPAGDGGEPDTGAAQDDDLVICRCEEITRGEIREAIRNGMQTLNGIKRVTRAGMGLCQGQTCQRLVAQIITEELGFAAADIDPTTARGPVRPLRLEVFANS